MARLSRIVVPDMPHHVTQRGNRRMPLLRNRETTRSIAICWPNVASIMTSRVWPIVSCPITSISFSRRKLTPQNPESLARAVGEAHRRYTGFVNARARVTGYLFQGRFASIAIDEQHLLNGQRYLAFNPVRAGLAPHAANWPWSSVAAHLAGRGDGLVNVTPVLDRVPRFADLLDMSLEEQMEMQGFETKSVNGRPAGSPGFIARVEAKFGRSIQRGKPGPKARE